MVLVFFSLMGMFMVKRETGLFTAPALVIGAIIGPVIFLLPVLLPVSQARR